jgi:hypothetical protein
VSEVFGTDDALSCSMPMEFIATGVLGQDARSINVVAPSTRTYYLFNKSASTVSWTAVDDQSWLTLSTAGGTVAAGKATSVTLSVASSWTTLAAGAYQGTLVLTDTGSGFAYRKKVQLTVLPATTPLVYYKFNDTTGTAVVDSSGCGRTGTLQGGGGFDPFAKNGFSSYENLNAVASSGVQIPALNVYSNTFTQCCWIYPTGIMPEGAGIIYHRGTNTVAGLQWKNGLGNTPQVFPPNQLGYNWNDQAANYSWFSGLVPPLNQWSFVALVITPISGTIYLYDGATWRSSVNLGFHDIEQFDTTGNVGYDTYATNRVTQGYIDEAMEIGASLTQSQLNTIATMTDPSVAKATNPAPSNLQVGILSKVLHWTPTPAQIDNQVVYIGTFNNGVNNATTVTSQYYLTSTKGATAVMSTLAYATTYYWRVDTWSKGIYTKGDLWSFQTGQNPAAQPTPYAWYRLDDTTGTTVRDSAPGARNGILYGWAGNAQGNAYWMGGRNDGALRLDRLSTTSVAVPSLAIPSTATLAITAWIRPLSTSVAGSTNEGIVCYKTGATSTGLIITNKGDLGAMWNGVCYGSNGLIPSYDTWNYVAMSVSPTTLTLYLNDGRGSGMKSVTLTGGYSSIAFDGAGRLGWADVGRAQNHLYSGGIDDVRIYKQFLTALQIYGTLETATPNLPDPASFLNPLYPNNANSPFGTTFRWTAANAQVHDIYMNVTNLTDAAGTPVYVGTKYGPPALSFTAAESYMRYMIAIDESNSGGFAPSNQVFMVRTILNAVDGWMNYLN